MIKGKTLGILALTTAAVIAAAYLAERKDQRGQAELAQKGTLLLPQLAAGKLNDAARVTLVSGGQKITLERQDKTWGVAEKDHHPADVGKIRGLLVGASQLTIVEPKTAKAELLPQLGLDDPSKDGSESTLMEIADEKGQPIAALTIGKQRPAKGSPERSDIYVRPAGSEQSWLVEGTLTLAKRPQDWLDKTLLSLDDKRVREIRITHADGERVVVAKDSAATPDYNVVTPKSDKKPANAFEVNNIASTLAHLTADDVKPVGAVSLPAKERTIVVAETFDGLRVTLTSAEVDGQRWATLKAESFTPAPSAAVAPPAPQAAAPAGQEATTQPEHPKPTPQAVDPAKIQQEAEALNTKFANWVYVLPSFNYASLAKRGKDVFAAEAPGH